MSYEPQTLKEQSLLNELNELGYRLNPDEEVAQTPGHARAEILGASPLHARFWQEGVSMVDLLTKAIERVKAHHTRQALTGVKPVIP